MGIALGAGWAVQSIADHVAPRLMWHVPQATKGLHPGHSQTVAQTKQKRHFPIDYRFLLLGSMLPDLIDKPLSLIATGNMFIYGRSFAHTLLFLVLLFVISFALHGRRGQSGMFCLIGGVAAHLILDQIWLQPQVLLWPTFGWGFAGHAYSAEEFLINRLTRPDVYVPEVIGSVVIAWFLIELLVKHHTLNFARTGRIWATSPLNKSA